ncbi:MAG: aldo/keto reductase [Firmicutes bacterium]|nr:aldo/keto reductase [Bacillota bacterium]
MQTVEIGGGVRLSEMVFGGTKRSGDEANRLQFAMMDRYMELGGNTFDSARIYCGGMSDKYLGDWIRMNGIKRDEVVLSLKGCSPPKSDPYAFNLSPEHIKGELYEALDLIGTDHADVYLLHRDDPSLPVDEIMGALHELVQEGRTLTIGCSNWTAARIVEANRYAEAHGLTPFSVSQVFYSLAQTTPMQARDLTLVTMNDVEKTWYQESGMPVMAFGSMGRGFFHAYAENRPQRERAFYNLDYLPENMRRAERAVTLAKELGCSLGAVLGAYVRDSLKAVALCSFTKAHQLEDSMAMADVRLTREQIRFLESGERG